MTRYGIGDWMRNVMEGLMSGMMKDQMDVNDGCEIDCQIGY